MENPIATLSQNGSRLSIRLPKEIELTDSEFDIQVEGNEIILTFKAGNSWRNFFQKTPLPSDDFMNEREDFFPQIREQL